MHRRSPFPPVLPRSRARKFRRVVPALLLCLGLDLVAAQQVELVSRPPNPNYFGPIGALPSGATGCSMSSSGTRIAFATDAFNLIEDDRNRVADVVVHDLVTGTLQLVSRTSDGAQADGAALRPRIDGDGRYVLFETAAPNLGGSGETRVYRRDLQTGQTELASIDVDGVPFTSASISSDLSIDGNMALFSADNQLWLRDFSLGQTERISTGIDGQPADQLAAAGVLAEAGGIVVFDSAATNLVSGDSNGLRDVFFFDRLLGTIERLEAPGSVEPDGASSAPDVSLDGRWVTFSSAAANFVAGDTEGESDVFLHDRQTGTTIRLSEDGSGIGGNDFSQRPKISHDGRFVVFESRADNLVPGLSGNETRLFLYDRVRDRLDRVAATAGTPTEPCIVAVGTDLAIAYRSGQHPDLPAGTNPAQMMLEGFDPTARGSVVTRVLSAREPPLPVRVGTGNSDQPQVSANGTFLAFRSSADNLVGRSGFRSQIVRLDLQSGQVQAVSQTADGDFDGAFTPSDPAISGNGNRVAFLSRSSLLVPGITNNLDDVFVRDLQFGQTRRVSVASDGSEANGGSGRPRISANGNSVVFQSRASNLVVGDTNNREDIYVHDIDTAATERVSISTAGAESTRNSVFAEISADGRFVVFESSDSLLDDPTPISSNQIWLRDRQLGTTELISAAPDGTPGNGFSARAQISAGGRWIAFESSAGNLDPAFPGVSGESVYLHDRQTGETRLVSLDETQQPLVDSLIDNLVLAAGGQVLGFSRTIDSGGGMPNAGSGSASTRGAELPEIYLVRLDPQQTLRIEPRTVDGLPPDADVSPAALSANGRILYLVSQAGNLVPDMLNGFRDVYHIDLDRVFGDGFEG